MRRVPEKLCKRVQNDAENTLIALGTFVVFL